MLVFIVLSVLKWRHDQMFYASGVLPYLSVMLYYPTPGPDFEGP